MHLLSLLINQEKQERESEMTIDKRKVVYQIYPKSYKDTTGNGVGDLRGIIEKLPYLKELGIDMIWLNPFYPSPQRDNGYDISDYTAVNPDFGTMEDFEEMVAVEAIVVPAHGIITFAPAGYHLMCMSPGDAVTPGGAVSVTLTFADGGTLSADFPVRSATDE